MSKPLTVFLQLLALFLLLYGYATEQHGLIIWALVCGVIGAVGIRQRMKDAKR
ncbi:MAG: hypothetical protein AB7E55_23410 [Pigmentiphaga sp.]